MDRYCIHEQRFFVVRVCWPLLLLAGLVGGDRLLCHARPLTQRLKDGGGEGVLFFFPFPTGACSASEEGDGPYTILSRSSLWLRQQLSCI